MSSAINRPGVALGIYPERKLSRSGWLQQAVGRIGLFCRATLLPLATRPARLVDAIRQHEKSLAEKSTLGLAGQARCLRQRFASQGQTNDLLAECFALVGEVSRRTLDITFTDEQLMAGWFMFRGELAELGAGEGKTTACLLPACAAALAGIPTQVVSADDGLAQRMAQRHEPVYVALGISMGLVVAQTPLGQRRAAYQSDITHCGTRQLASDYLQDLDLLKRRSGELRLQVNRLSRQTDNLRLRGLCYAIVDDADAVLVDESLRPLVLSRSVPSGTAGADPSQEEIVGRINLPRLFQRYVRLCGIAANLRDLAPELHDTYGVVTRVARSRRPSRQPLIRESTFLDRASKCQAIKEHILAAREQGQPVVVATRSAADSEHLGELLKAAAVPHQQLDSLEGASFSKALANAGGAGTVTVSSRLVAPGIEIPLDERAVNAGGLLVILSERHAAARLDNRVFGLCARRGQPGSRVVMVSLEDAQACEFLPGWVCTLLRNARPSAARLLLRLAQKKHQRLESQARRRMLTADQQLDELLAFSGAAT